MQRQAAAPMPTSWGDLQIIAYSDSPDERLPHLALQKLGYDPALPVLVRLHSECMTGDLFGSHRCDCGEQLHAALAQIAEQGGVLIYLRQEGRGIGLINKLRAYQLQDAGADTIEANTHLGFAADARRYDDAIAILQDLGIQNIRLLTNNPDKIHALEEKINIAERIPLLVVPHASNEAYLRTKRDLMGHWLTL